MARNQEVATREPTANVTPGGGKDFFRQYGEQAAQRSSIVGKILKFNKGDWLLGQDEEEIPVGTRYVAAMDQFLIGWVKWVDNKPVEHNMGRLVDGWTAPKRDALGDTDKDQWEVDQNGKPRDPWQFSNQVLMKPVGKQYSLDNAITFVTSSRGGIGAAGALCIKYSDEYRTKDGQNPIVELGADSYKHSNAEFGRIKVPVLTLVGWEKASLFDHSSVAAEDDEEEDRSAKKNGKTRAAKRR